METPRSKQEIFYPNEEEDLSNIAQELGSKMKEAFAHASKEFFHEHLGLKTSGFDELSVEVYDRLQDIKTRIEDLQDETTTKNLPKDAALLVIRFPTLFHYDPDEAFSPKANFKGDVTRMFWKMRDAFQDEYGVEIERVNPIAIHDGTEKSGFYYIWLVTPPNKMPKQFQEQPEDAESSDDEY